MRFRPVWDRFNTVRHRGAALASNDPSDGAHAGVASLMRFERVRDKITTQSGHQTTHPSEVFT